MHKNNPKHLEILHKSKYIKIDWYVLSHTNDAIAMNGNNSTQEHKSQIDLIHNHKI